MSGNVNKTEFASFGIETIIVNIYSDSSSLLLIVFPGHMFLEVAKGFSAIGKCALELLVRLIVLSAIGLEQKLSY